MLSPLPIFSESVPPLAYCFSLRLRGMPVRHEPLHKPPLGLELDPFRVELLFFQVHLCEVDQGNLPDEVVLQQCSRACVRGWECLSIARVIPLPWLGVRVELNVGATALRSGQLERVSFPCLHILYFAALSVHTLNFRLLWITLKQHSKSLLERQVLQAPASSCKLLHICLHGVIHSPQCVVVPPSFRDRGFRVFALECSHEVFDGLMFRNVKLFRSHV